jgi:hypothetical protein
MSEFEYEHECPECKTVATFKEGPLFGALQCQECEFTPPAAVREEIRDNAEEAEREFQ